MNLSALRPLYEHPGPWASVYLDAARNSENAAQEIDLRWRALRESLIGQGAEPATVAALEAAVLARDATAGHAGLALFGTGGELVLVERLSSPPRAEVAVWEPLPHVMPLVAQLGEEVCWLRVLADRAGGALDGFTSGGVARHGSRNGKRISRQVDGDETFPIRKVKPGGWSQPRFQRAAEVAWQRNAGDVAAAAAHLADDIGADVLVVGGDVRAVQLLIDQLPARWKERVVRTGTGTRTAGADNDLLDDEVLRAVADVAAQHTNDVLERFHIQYGSDAAAGSGLPAVVAALQRGQVDTVLLVDDPSSTAKLWIGPDPYQIALDADELHAMGVTEPRQVRADAALLRSIALTDARLALVGPDDAPLEGGLGAVLRYADAGTRHR